MPRRLRIEFDGAIYHVMTRCNARRLLTVVRYVEANPLRARIVEPIE